MGKSDRSSTTAVLVDRPPRAFARLLFAHGAGASMDSPVMNDMAAALVSRGFEVVRFEFPYMARRRENGTRRPPDKLDRLLETWDNVIRHYAQMDDLLPLWIGGKSMGGRMATVWMAERGGSSCKGAICFGYPFHPAGKPDQRRIGHLPAVALPVFIVQGERDALGGREEVRDYGDLGQHVHIHWLSAANHDLKPLRSSGRTHRECIQEAAEVAASFAAEKAPHTIGSNAHE